MTNNPFTLLSDARHYMKVWPQQPQLNVLFPETRVIKATELSMNVMPVIAVLVAWLQITHFGTEYVPQALAFAAFFISLPLQGMIWLGFRANSNLPPFLARWYREIQQKMQSIGLDSQLTRIKPRYLDLALLLKKAFDEMDKSFTREMF